MFVTTYTDYGNHEFKTVGVYSTKTLAKEAAEQHYTPYTGQPWPAGQSWFVSPSPIFTGLEFFPEPPGDDVSYSIEEFTVDAPPKDFPPLDDSDEPDIPDAGKQAGWPAVPLFEPWKEQE